MVRKVWWLPSVLVPTLVATLVAASAAQDLTNRLGIGGGYGGMKVIPDSSGVKAKFGPYVPGHLLYGLNSHWLVTAGASWGRGKPDFVSTEAAEPDSGFEAVVIAYELGIDWRLLGKSRITPYLEAGGGTSVWRTFRFGVRTNGGTDFSWRGGGGLQFGITNNIMLDVGARYHRIEKPKDLDLLGIGDRAKAYFDISATLNLLTNPLHARDTDMDGVPDVRDKCPDTPKGCIVDENGCPKDSDNDGVCDGLDQCPDTPVGCVVDAQGCPKDSDGDGVCDGVDTCPDTPRGCIVDANGCPRDTDGDGVCDGVDQCPGTPAGVRVDARGCPAETTTTGEVMPPAENFLEPIHFDFDRFNVRPGDAEILRGHVQTLRDNPDWTVTIHGHCDWIGTDEYNQVLGEKRASSAKRWLVQHGVRASRLDTMSHGEKDPVADNTTDEGRAQNRRAEFEVHKP
jgi:OOP family OmpA-OmpF porin